MGPLWRCAEFHVSLGWGFVSFFQIAFSAAGDKIFPSLRPTCPARDNMVNGEILGDSAILASIVIAGEN